MAWVLVVAIVACKKAEEKPAAGAPSSRTVVMSVSAPQDASSDVTATSDAGVAAAAMAVKRTGKAWPFHAWDRAEAITFNQFRARQGVPLHVLDEEGWSPHIAQRKALDHALAQEAVALVEATEGDVDVSKCPFPRHAVVLYSGKTPVASINVCFSCGDIMLWPRWAPEPDWDKLTKKQDRELERRAQKQMKLYEQAFPRWKTFFRDRVGFAIDKRFD